MKVSGIARSGSQGNYNYSVLGSGNRPVTYVSWFDAARFVNWLNNGKPVGLQTPGSTDSSQAIFSLNNSIDQHRISDGSLKTCMLIISQRQEPRSAPVRREAAFDERL